MKTQQRHIGVDKPKLHSDKTNQRLSLPSLKLHSVDKTKQFTANGSHTFKRYHSQRKNIQNIDQKTSFKPQIKLGTKNVEQQTRQPLSKDNPVYRSRKYGHQDQSPSKIKTRLNQLPDILSEGKFIRKNQDSLDTSKQEDDNAKKQVLYPKSFQSAEPQLWIIKKQTIETSQKSFLQQIVNQNLQKQQSHKFQPTLVTQPSISTSTSKLLRPIQAPDQGKTKLVGPQAVQRFYSQYKKIDRIKQLQQIKKEYNPITVILTILESYNIPPKRMDIIKLRGSESILDLNHIGLGQSISIRAISDILQKLNYFKTINLSYNAITFDRVDIIIPQLKGVRKIDLSHNRISRQGADLLASYVCIQENNRNDGDSSSEQSNSDSQTSHLQQLNLQQNGLSDQSLNLFLTNAKSYRHVKILNLSKNFLGNHFALRLKEFLIDERHLNELYLHWNDITSKGMKNIFEALTINGQLKVLDLSWNQIGFEAIPAMCNFIKKNLSLLHLDVSNCNISFTDTKQIALSIQQNFTIFGLHYEGNQGKVDPMGFIIPLKENSNKNSNFIRHQVLQRINSVQQNIFHNSRYDNGTKESLKTCWICNGWSQRTIVIKKNPQLDQACFIHFDFEDFKGVAMSQVQGNFHLKKMFPSQRTLFFITKVNNSKQFIHQAAIQYKGLNKFDSHKLSKALRIQSFFIEQKEFKNVELMDVNGIGETGIGQDEMFDERYVYQFACRPRTYGAVVDRGLFIVDKKPKVIRKKQRNKDNDKKARELQPMQLVFTQQSPTKAKSFIQQCAQFDISNSKTRKLLWNSQQIHSISQVLQQHYSTFINIFHHLSSHSVNSVSSIYYVSETKLDQFLDFMQFENRELTRAKIRLKVVATLSVNDQFTKGETKGHVSEQKLFVRAQFFQFLLRVAMEKYCRVKKSQDVQKIRSPCEAFQKLIKSLTKYEQTLPLPMTWRRQHLHTYEISLTIRSYSHFLESLYDTYAGSNQRNMNTRMGKKMLLNEFKQIFLDVGMRKTRESLKDAELAFADSKEPEVEEGIRQGALGYTEFLQAMVRMAYCNDLKPIGTLENKVWQRIQQIKSHHEIGHAQDTNLQIPLFLKFQGLLKTIYQQNRQIYHSGKMDRIFQRGVFPDEIQMLIEILKLRVDHCHEKAKSGHVQKPTNKKIKLNSMDEEERREKLAQDGNQSMSQKITLEYLVQELKQKYKKISDELDLNFNDYEEISQVDETT